MKKLTKKQVKENLIQGENFIMLRQGIVLSIVIAMFCSMTFARSEYLFIGEKNRETVFGKIIDEEGNPVIARVELWYRELGEIADEEGKPTPPQYKYTRNLFHSDFSDEKGWYHVTGFPGEYILRISKGPEWEIREIPVDIRMIERPLGQGSTTELDGQRIDVTLKRLYDLGKYGWYGGDLHHHTFHSDGRNTPRQVYHSALASGLSWCSLNEHNNMVQNEMWYEWTDKNFLAVPGCEVTPNNLPADEASNVRKGYGHHNYFLPPEYMNVLIGQTDPENPVIWDRCMIGHYSQIQAAIDHTHALGGLWMLNHPMFGYDWPDGTQSNWGVLKNYDAIEIWNGENPPHTPNLDLLNNPKSLFALNTMACQLWFEMLNAGNRIAGWGSSDSHDATGLTYGSKGPYDHRGVTGFATTYVHMDSLKMDRLRDGLKNGAVFICAGTFGPIVLATVNYTQNPGDDCEPKKIWKIQKLAQQYKNNLHIDKEITYDAVEDYYDNIDYNSKYVHVEIRILSNRPLEEYDNGIRIIKDGKVLRNFSTTKDVYTMKINTLVEIKEEKDTWFVIEAFGKYPSVAITNPFFIEADGKKGWGNKKWTFPAGASQWGNPWPKSPDITVPDGPAKPWYDLPQAPVSFEKPIDINDYLNPDNTLKNY